MSKTRVIELNFRIPANSCMNSCNYKPILCSIQKGLPQLKRLSFGRERVLSVGPMREHIF